MVVGFTGTRRGMTHAQKAAVAALLAGSAVAEAHHGDCVGADADFHYMALAAGAEVTTHPCTLEDQRAYCVGAAHEMEVLPPLVRNKNIVAACDVLIATPATAYEEGRSGTWSTVRHAHRTGKTIILVLPDGSLTDYA